MSIEEKNKALEFTYMPDNIASENSEVFSVDIIYDDSETSGHIFPLTLKQGQMKINCPVELIWEVADALKSKGISVGGATTSVKTATMNNNSSLSPSNIPLPEIDGVTEGAEDATEASLIESEPLTSLDFSEIPVVEDVVENVVENAVENTESSSETIKVGDQEVITEKVIDRQVIRTKRNSDNPLQVEQDSAMMRGESKKIIKRLDD